MSRSDQPIPPPTTPAGGGSAPAESPGAAETSRRPPPMLVRVFAANAAVFALAFALLALAPVELHASIRVEELVLLLVGLLVMLIVDLVLVRHALAPLRRLARLMGTVDLLRPGRRATGFGRSSSEVLSLADAFNAMIERLEAERRDSSARVLAAQEQERLRIARELHDEIGQTLTAVVLRAELTAAQTADSRPELAELAELVNQSLADVRRISLELRPGALDELGLLNALISLCARVADHSSLRVRRELQGPVPQMPPEVELAVYRIAQEALTNVMRHAQASEAVVSLTCVDDQLVLSIRDNGRGLPAHPVDGGGLTGMRERAMLIGADLAIGASADGGVDVTLRLGLASER